MTKLAETTYETMPCSVDVTARAKQGIEKWIANATAFFSLQSAFIVHIEKRPNNKYGNMAFSLFFDNEKNKVLKEKFNERVAVLECVYKNEGLVATSFQVRGKREPVHTNRRYEARLKFHVGRSGIAMPIELYTNLLELPIAEERSAYVEKRIASWESYLRVQERNADVADITSSFSGARFNESFTKLTVVCHELKGNEWQTLRGFSVKMTGFQNDVGSVSNVNRSMRTVEIELNTRCKELARKNEWLPNSYKEIIFSNFAELSQVKRLRKGFKDLQDGLAANANLEKILFDNRPVVRITNKKQDLIFQNELNEFQQEAVTGAMTANDLYVIQGPPGTGKTTVISEICHQNVKAGLRTLVASQANLAVDNALSRLLADQDVRILRYGRTESIEEEGKRFIEENVALTWRNETLAAVNEKLREHEYKESQITKDLKDNEQQLVQVQNELAIIDEEIRVKEKAQIKYDDLTKEIEKFEQKIRAFDKERTLLVDSKSSLKQLASVLVIESDEIEQFLQDEKMSEVILHEMEQLPQEIGELRSRITYLQTVEQIQETENVCNDLTQNLERKQCHIEAYVSFIKESETVTKLNTLKQQLQAFGIMLPPSLHDKMGQVQQRVDFVKADDSAKKFAEWVQLDERLLTAIEKLKQILEEHGYIKQLNRRPENQKFTTIEAIHDMIDRVGRHLVQPQTKQLLATKNYSAARYDCLDDLTLTLEILHERRHFVRLQMKPLEQLTQEKLDIVNAFALMKAEIIEHVNHLQKAIEIERVSINDDLEHNQMELELLLNTKVNCLLQHSDEKVSLTTLKKELQDKEKVVTVHEEKLELLKQRTLELDGKKQSLKENNNKLEQLSIQLTALNEQIESTTEEKRTHEEVLHPLSEIVKQNPEEQREQKLVSYYALAKKIEQQNIELERYPMTKAVQQQWAVLLSEASDYDLDEIRKLYVQHANVIGTTCVASARRDFVEEYPTFDVVIIDEVSKATPPELLLPMLKGKKIILVGDHHQLPPLMGQETLEELLEEIDNQQHKKELDALLKESLFERLFRTLPKQNKTMLAIQYRMHESIMDTITPFYKEGDYGLQCGLTDSDTVRDHYMESEIIGRNDHLLWFDMPNKPANFEEKVKGGTSRFNPSELTTIKKLLIDLEAATIKAKSNGLMNADEKKSVGVISFYGEQVKRIDRLIEQEIMPTHLHCRTGSVDKFQGMEMDIIILSFVRNHADKSGDIGFARDYRRLNVALSRARELLIIVGSSDMFTMRAKHESTKDMYGRLLDGVKMKKGLRDYDGNMKM